MKFIAYLLATALLPASLWSATLTGAVHRSDSTTRVITGAKVVVLLNNAKVDSTTTNASGQYTLTLTAGTNYTLQFSAVGFKDSLGYAVRSIMIALTTGANILNVNLTPATSTIFGRVITIIGVSNPTAPSLAKTAAFPVFKIVLQRQSVSNGNWMLLDSTFSDSIQQTFFFSNLIAATGGSSGGYYRLIASLRNWAQLSSNTNLIVSIGAIDTSNISMSSGGAIHPVISNNSDIRFSRLGNKLLLDLEISSLPRSVKIFDLNGALQHQVSILAGNTQVFVPAIFAPENGFFFILK